VKKGRCVVSVEGATFEMKRISAQTLEIDGKEQQYDFRPIGDRAFSLILDGKSLVFNLIGDDASTGAKNGMDGFLGQTVRISIQGREYSVLVDDDRSLLFKKFVSKGHSTGGAQVIRAPMPGLISRVEVEVGQEVTKGQGLLVLEAMKMENELRATGSGRVKKVHVEKGKPVEKDASLITIEEL
jgi:biotin carboxyl carrier protein